MTRLSNQVYNFDDSTDLILTTVVIIGGGKKKVFPDRTKFLFLLLSSVLVAFFWGFFSE